MKSMKLRFYILPLVFLSSSELNAGSYIFAQQDYESVIAHPKGYDGTGGEFTVTIGISPNSTSVEQLEDTVLNAIEKFNSLDYGIENYYRDEQLGANQIDLESVMIHELGHCAGLGHTTISPGDDESITEDESGYTISTSGDNGVFDLDSGTDGIQGTADDLRGDDQNLHWFVSGVNNPFELPEVIDSTTYTRDLDQLPFADSYVANPSEAVGAELGVANTQAVMFWSIANGWVGRLWSADDVATLKYAQSGVDKIQGTSDDYTFRYEYVGVTNDADLVIDSSPQEGNTLAYCAVEGYFISDDDIQISSMELIIDTDVDWYYSSRSTEDDDTPQEPSAAVAFDYDGDGKADVAVRRPSTSLQYIYNSSDQEIQRVSFGLQESDIPVAGDFDGDGIYDIAVRRPGNATWYIINSSGVDSITGNEDGITRLNFGQRSEDIPVAADYDGDGITDIAVRRPSTAFWYIRNSTGEDSLTGNNDGISRLRFGIQSEDVPVPADYDGDGKADIAVRRPSTALWYINNSSGEDLLTDNSDGISRFRFGRQSEDIAAPADYDGDGKADIAVRRPSTALWYINNSSGEDLLTSNSDGISRFRFGTQSEDIAVPADYDGDGKVDIAVRRPSTQLWYINNSDGVDVLTNNSDGITRLNFGLQATDIPLSAPSHMQPSLIETSTTLIAHD